MPSQYQLIQIKRTNSSFSTLSSVTPAFGEMVFSHTPSVDSLAIGDGINSLYSLPAMNVTVLSNIQANPSLLVNLSSTTAASVFTSAPRPGVTGVLGIANGGTGSTTQQGAREGLGLPNITFGSTPPTTPPPVNGDLFINSSTYKLQVYNNGSWHDITATAVWG